MSVMTTSTASDRSQMMQIMAAVVIISGDFNGTVSLAETAPLRFKMKLAYHHMIVIGLQGL